MITAESLLLEMQSFVNVPSTIIAEARTTGMNTDNSPEFAEIVEGWSEGRYDEDPDYVVTEIDQLLD